MSVEVDIVSCLANVCFKSFGLFMVIVIINIKVDIIIIAAFNYDDICAVRVAAACVVVGTVVVIAIAVVAVVEHQYQQHRLEHSQLAENQQHDQHHQ